MAEPGRLSLRENEEGLLRQGLDVTTTKPLGVAGSYPRKYCDDVSRNTVEFIHWRVYQW